METAASRIARQIERLKVLVVDDEASMRRVVRALLQSLGITDIVDVADGQSALDRISVRAPDLVLLDWEMPTSDGPAFMRALRSPDTFPQPDVPVSMLTGHSEQACVVEAMRLGVNEYLLKPVSSTGLLSRIVSILMRPRPMIRRGDYYGPGPRGDAPPKPTAVTEPSDVFFVN